MRGGIPHPLPVAHLLPIVDAQALPLLQEADEESTPPRLPGDMRIKMSVATISEATADVEKAVLSSTPSTRRASALFLLLALVRSVATLLVEIVHEACAVFIRMRSMAVRSVGTMHAATVLASIAILFTLAMAVRWIHSLLTAEVAMPQVLLLPPIPLRPNPMTTPTPANVLAMNTMVLPPRFEAFPPRS